MLLLFTCPTRAMDEGGGGYTITNPIEDRGDHKEIYIYNEWHKLLHLG